MNNTGQMNASMKGGKKSSNSNSGGGMNKSPGGNEGSKNVVPPRKPDNYDKQNIQNPSYDYSEDANDEYIGEGMVTKTLFEVSIYQ